MSSATFDDDELALLNKGLNFNIKPMKPPALETVIDVETMLKYKLPQTQKRIRDALKPLIIEVKNTRPFPNNQENVLKRL